MYEASSRKATPMIRSARRSRSTTCISWSCQTTTSARDDLDQRVEPEPGERDRARGEPRAEHEHRADDVPAERRVLEPQPATTETLPGWIAPATAEMIATRRKLLLADTCGVGRVRGPRAAANGRFERPPATGRRWGATPVPCYRSIAKRYRPTRRQLRLLLTSPSCSRIRRRRRASPALLLRSGRARRCRHREHPLGVDRRDVRLAVPLVDDDVAGQKRAELRLDGERLVGERRVAGT